MTVGSFELKRQLGGRGQYAYVELEIVPEAIARDSLLDSEFSEAAEAGAQAILEHFNKVKHFVVLDLIYSNCDTDRNNMWIAGAMAMWRALKTPGAEPQIVLDEKHGIMLEFPEVEDEDTTKTI